LVAGAVRTGSERGTIVKRARLLAASLLVVTGVLAPPSAAVADGGASDADQPCAQRLEAAIHDFDAAFIARDFDGFMAWILDDAVQINSVGEVFDGKAAIAGFTRAVMANEYTFTASPITRKLHKCESAIDVADTVFAIPSRPLTLHLIDTVGWVRVDGQWRVTLIQNTEIPT
jgi:uncharacterized protein (TIGR02246 family)